MSKSEFVPALGEQFNHVWNKGLNYKGFDLKFFTDKSHFQHNIALQSCYYGLNGVGKYAKTTFRDLIKYPKDKTLIGDSAGFQIASFKIRGEVCNIEPIDSLRWQEKNVDIGMNLDIPSTLSGVPTYNDFVKALNASVKNFQLFQDERKNYDMKLYNVLHGESLKMMELWYNEVKHFKFDGWAVGMKPPSDPMIQAMGFLFLYEKGELSKSDCYGIHFFGTSGKHVAPTLSYIASKINNRVTYDSSSYNIGSIFRTYYSPYDIGPVLSFGGKFKTENPEIKELPCNCPVCKSITDINDLNGDDIYPGTLISLHDLYQYIEYNRILNSIVCNKDKFMEYLNAINASKKTIKSIEFVDYAMKEGLKKAVVKFSYYLIPQEINKTEQKGLHDF